MKQKITKKDFEAYVSGWLFTTADFERDELDMENIHAALANALSQLYCDQDGIEAVTARRALDEDADDELSEYFSKLTKESEEPSLSVVVRQLARSVSSLEETIREKSFCKANTYLGPQ